MKLKFLKQGYIKYIKKNWNDYTQSNYKVKILMTKTYRSYSHSNKAVCATSTHSSTSASYAIPLSLLSMFIIIDSINQVTNCECECDEINNNEVNRPHSNSKYEPEFITNLSNINVAYQSNQVIYNWSGTHCSQYDPNSHGFTMWEPKNEEDLYRALKYYLDLNVNSNNSKSIDSDKNSNVTTPLGVNENESECQIHRKCRPIGSSLSPNGIGMPHRLGDALTMAHFHFDANPNTNTDTNPDSAMHIDIANKLVTVSAGCSVRHVLKELKKSNLTIENYSSITEQQIGGWMQVAGGSRLGLGWGYSLCV